MKRILSVFLLIAMTVSTFAILPAQAAAPITSTEEDSIVPSPWDSIETEGGRGGCAAPPSYSCRGDLLYLVRLSTKRMRMVATCARVALP